MTYIEALNKLEEYASVDNRLNDIVDIISNYNIWHFLNALNSILPKDKEEVLVKLDNGDYHICIYNGTYWTQHTEKLIGRKQIIAWKYIE